MADLSWVIGAGGLLGSAVRRQLAVAGLPRFDGPRIHWQGGTASTDLGAGLQALVSAAGRGTWQVFWCAGAAVTTSDVDSLDHEFRTLRYFLDRVGALPRDQRERGSIVFASSAGAVYGGSTAPPFTEDSSVSPLGHYGEAKLRAEDALQSLSAGAGIPIVLARIANLYGPGQNLAKQQGIVSKLCFSTVTRTPLPVFVSLDTLRDYLYVDDCARMLIRCGERIGHRDAAPRLHLKIVASGHAVSIAALLGQFRLLGGPQPLVVMGTSRESSLQSRDLRLRSTRWTDIGPGSSTTLSEGIARTIADMRLVWLQQGRFAETLRTARSV
ncbi:NAD-dependent epimerase/dehydratase family protein [Planctomonas psychrotolerans]|uniref:NAD-dependent epimerase/dehydratase family protein n=1 Tax=Planctomonas psychrotolerans TaxID=2528712 RepID=UPI00123A649D|nr:NAD-dependent epimerase/dehydratase family protein [Planctomonas psychrotolerans]